MMQPNPKGRLRFILDYQDGDDKGMKLEVYNRKEGVLLYRLHLTRGDVAWLVEAFGEWLEKTSGNLPTRRRGNECIDTIGNPGRQPDCVAG